MVASAKVQPLRNTALPTPIAGIGAMTAGGHTAAFFWIVMIGLAMAWVSVFSRDNSWHQLPARIREGRSDD